MTPHISNQLGTENACETLLCLFIIMIWALVWDNMYRYGRHFGSSYRNPTISDGFRLPRSTRQIFFVEIQHEIILAPMCLCQRKMWKSNVNNICFFISHVGLPQFKSTWVLRGVSCWLGNHLPCQHTATERQNIIDRTHTWQQCSFTISEDILTTKYSFNQSQIDFTAKHRKQTR